jgi:hypothetical protein
MKATESKIRSSATSKELVVFSILRESRCKECNQQLWKGNFLFMEADRPLCLCCADLDHLTYLPRGDAALTRRARKYSPLSAVVVRFSRSRGRYERQGILIAEAALERAEEECLADSEQRSHRRERDALRRAEYDVNLVVQMTGAILKLFPSCPSIEARTIAEHTARRHSGRVGRTSAGQSLAEEALTLAVVAYVRHRHTRYDELLTSGNSRADARGSIREDLDRVLETWRQSSLP